MTPPASDLQQNIGCVQGTRRRNIIVTVAEETMSERRHLKPNIPYVPFKTFLSSLDSLASELPARIGYRTWTNFGVSTHGQLLSTYRFLGLVAEDGTPTSDLQELVANRENRPALLRKILLRRYAVLTKLDLSKASPAHLDSELRKYRLDGNTVRKAASFFLEATKFAGVPLSPLFLKKGSRAVFRRRLGEAPESYPSRLFRLPGGTTVNLTISRDVLHLPPGDRKIVLHILERLEEYEASGSERPANGKSSNEDGAPE